MNQTEKQELMKLISLVQEKIRHRDPARGARHESRDGHLPADYGGSITERRSRKEPPRKFKANPEVIAAYLGKETTDA